MPSRLKETPKRRIQNVTEMLCCAVAKSDGKRMAKEKKTIVRESVVLPLDTCRLLDFAGTYSIFFAIRIGASRCQNIEEKIRLMIVVCYSITEGLLRNQRCLESSSLRSVVFQDVCLRNEDGVRTVPRFRADRSMTGILKVKSSLRRAALWLKLSLERRANLYLSSIDNASSWLSACARILLLTAVSRRKEASKARAPNGDAIGVEMRIVVSQYEFFAPPQFAFLRALTKAPEGSR